MSLTSPLERRSTRADQTAPRTVDVADDTSSSATYTFLFTDMEGSTEGWETTPEMSEVVERHFAVLRTVVHDRGGDVFATMGDGIAAAFDSADAAVRAAIAAQRAFVREGLRVRMGLHTGEALRAGNDYRGRTLNRAARINAVGHGGQILLSDVTAHLVRASGRAVEVHDLGRHRLRDLTEPERIWQVHAHGLPNELPPLRSLDASPNNLPVQRSTFVGREAELTEVAAALARHRIVTLMGPGGVGKSRLALQAAAERSCGTNLSWFVSLAGVAGDDDVLGAIAATLDVDTGPRPVDALRSAFDGRPVLLVLDNCEQVIDAAARAVRQLTGLGLDLRVLATSREPLDIDGEFVVPVRPLDPGGDALELFELRALACGAPLTAGQRPITRQICERLDGLPLAIELAAARVPALGLAAIVDALDDRFSLLSGGRRHDIDRHQTLRATVEWSYQLLDDDARRLLEWLAMFPGGFELDAVRHTASVHRLEPSAAPDLIGSLVRKSMVEADLGTSVVRYRLLETVRAFALEALRERDETEQAAQSQAEWVARLTGLPVAEPCSAHVERNAIRLEREADNWRAAVLTASRSGSSDLARRLCGPPTRFFLLGRHDLCDLLLPLLDVCPDDADRREVVCAIAVATAGGGDPGQIRRWSDELAALSGGRSTGSSQLVEWMARSWAGEIDAGVELCLRASVDERLSQDTRDLFLGIATMDRFSLTDRTDDAAAMAERALEAARRTKVRAQRVTCLLGAAWALVDEQPQRSMTLAQEALASMPALPVYLQRTLPGNASRLMARVDARHAAADLLARLDVERSTSTYVDLIPAVYATMLLDRVGSPLAGPAYSTLAASPIASYLSLMGIDDLARRATAEYEPLPIDALVAMLRRGLEIEASSAPRRTRRTKEQQ
jgi:predicted ATPase/class 3 adenylate cyclase